MIGKIVAIAAGLGMLCLSGGCVSCGYELCKPVLDAAPNAEAPLCDRSHVYIFLLNGLTPSSTSGIDGLRLKLAERGYEKTYRCELCHAPWIEWEMKRVLKCDSSARFVIVGYDLGGTAAAAVGRHAARQGKPIDAVILLDPPSVPEAGSGCKRVVLIRSGGGGMNPTDIECVCVPDCGHWTLPTNERTVEAISTVLRDVAAKVDHPPVVVETLFEFGDAPPPREIAAPPPGASADWLFLNDPFGTHTRPLSPLPPSPSCAPSWEFYPSDPIHGRLPTQGQLLPIPKKLMPAP
jgi:hypothetical protein